MADDIFDDLFTIEDNFHTEGYKAGYADGLKQAGLEAHIFGVEQGYGKFLEMGQLQAKAHLWSASLSSNSRDAAQGRLDKHLTTLLALLDPKTLSFENNDDDVAAFDDRLKRAQAKVKIIERLLGEDESNAVKHPSASDGPIAKAAVGRAMEDFGT